MEAHVWLKEEASKWTDHVLLHVAKTYIDGWHDPSAWIVSRSDYVYRYRVLTNEIDRRGLNQ